MRPADPLPGPFAALFRRDLALARRHAGEAVQPVLFFAMAATLVPLGLAPEPETLARFAPGAIWMMALLAALLALDGLFAADYRDGSLEQVVSSPQPLWLLVLAKIFAHWLVAGLPLVMAAPVVGLALHLPAVGFAPLLLGLALGTASLSALGAVGAALTVAAPRGGLLLSLIAMPLYMPVLIFGAAAVRQAVEGLDPSGALAVLGALAALFLTLAPPAAAGALRVALDG